ncbi:ABC-F family ATPase [Quisquiliibacterium transsilvanicum]|uniref:Probable ATP-binding protein YbiT n=1 Tax=Quisquiliibacterium transsilvanicum TaxID=1549638 RepID=A0A7W8HE20_9BURK|nr:ABC-F family ATPase [Quisquiliibacterium transsilvanicum]MBB5270339.1 ATPase subunit of ABC transporter with duplicated ATPase domains [Quisquiliibacterium transsilvanicum]
MLSTVGLTMQFGAKPLFENVSVRFGDGNRYGLIGANGSGKSTFMKILGGDLESSAGQVMLDPNERLGKLRQDQFAHEDQRVIDVVMMGHEEMWAAMNERDAIYANPDASEEDYMRAADLEARFAEFGGYTAESRAGELLLGAGIPIDQHAGPMREIAPGWKLRVLLAQALFADPDVLLLDEPTNNLDINTIRWLEGVLNERDSTMVIISHDRHFLNAVCTHMADLDYGQLRVYPGSYDEYMFAAAEARARIAAANARSKERVAELQEFVQRFAANKAKARQATSRQKMIVKIKSEAVEVKPSSRQNPYIRFEVARPLHRVAVEVEGLGHRYPDAPAAVFSGVSLMVQAGEKIAIVGDSGAGKTTLLRTLIGPERGGLAPSFGSVKWAENADVGVMAQDVHPDFASDANLTDWIGRYTQAGDDEQVVRGVLGRLLFSGDEVRKPVKVLSGGEMHRMSFGRLMLGKHNVLLMDEPTNHLDMESIESLQLALEKFTGTLFIVSHDRQFVNAVANRVWIVKDGAIFDWQGTYDEYLESQGLS